MINMVIDPHMEGIDSVATTGTNPGGRQHASELSVLGGFRLVIDGEVANLPMRSERLLALLALQRRSGRRPHVAGVLWPDKSEARAQANLRAALWQIGQISTEIVVSKGQDLQLKPYVGTDFDRFSTWSERLITGRARLEDLRPPSVLNAWDLLPDWYEDWVDNERHRTKQRWLHAIEALTVELIRLRRFAQAVDVGLAAVGVDPLRESAHRAVVLAHLGENNLVEARRQYDRCRHHLDAELGVAPSPSLTALVESK